MLAVQSAHARADEDESSDESGSSFAMWGEFARGQGGNKAGRMAAEADTSAGSGTSEGEGYTSSEMDEAWPDNADTLLDGAPP